MKGYYKAKIDQPCFSSTRVQVSSTTHLPEGAKLLSVTSPAPQLSPAWQIPLCPFPPCEGGHSPHLTPVKNLAQISRDTCFLHLYPNKGNQSRTGNDLQKKACEQHQWSLQ